MHESMKLDLLVGLMKTVSGQTNISTAYLIYPACAA